MCREAVWEWILNRDGVDVETSSWTWLIESMGIERGNCQTDLKLIVSILTKQHSCTVLLNWWMNMIGGDQESIVPRKLLEVYGKSVSDTIMKLINVPGQRKESLKVTQLLGIPPATCKYK
jgi:hypothetical protein